MLYYIIYKVIFQPLFFKFKTNTLSEYLLILCNIYSISLPSFTKNTVNYQKNSKKNLKFHILDCTYIYNYTFHFFLFVKKKLKIFLKNDNKNFIFFCCILFIYLYLYAPIFNSCRENKSRTFLCLKKYFVGLN